MPDQSTSFNRQISDDMEIRIRLYEVIYLLAVPSVLIWHIASISISGFKVSTATFTINLVSAGFAFLLSKLKKLNYLQASNLFTVVLAVYSATTLYNAHINNYSHIPVFGCLIILSCGSSVLSSKNRVVVFAITLSMLVAIGSFVFAGNVMNALFFSVASALLIPAMSLNLTIYERLAKRTARLNTIYNNAAAGIVQVDSTGKIIQTNRKFLEMSEYKESDLNNLKLPQICHESDVDQIKTFLYNAGLEFAPQTEVRIQTKFGRFVWVRLVSNYQANAGPTDHLILLALDISQEKKLNELSSFQKQVLTMFARKIPFKIVIAEIAKFLSTQSGGLPVAISFLKDSVFEVTGSFNLPDNILAMLDKRPKKPGYGNSFEAVNKRDIDIVESIATSEAWTLYREENKQNPLAACWAFPIMNDIGHPAGVIEVFKYTEGSPNSTLVKSLEIFCSLAGMAVMVNNSEELQKTYLANLAQTAKLASLGEMAAGIAHEINNPMTIIQGRAEQIKFLLNNEEVDLIKVETIAENIMGNVQRVAKIIKGLRAFARFNSDMEIAPIQLVEVIDETIELCGERCRTNGVDLRVTISDPKITVSTRGTQLSQVLLNLLNNAYDAVIDRSDRWIDVKAIETVEFVQITVTDSGPGIPPAVADKLFQPFFTTKGVDKGTGLGLSMSHGIIADHGGRIYLDKNCRNTRFVIEMPRVKDLEQQKSA